MYVLEVWNTVYSNYDVKFFAKTDFARVVTCWHRICRAFGINNINKKKIICNGICTLNRIGQQGYTLCVSYTDLFVWLVFNKIGYSLSYWLISIIYLVVFELLVFFTGMRPVLCFLHRWSSYSHQILQPWAHCSALSVSTRLVYTQGCYGHYIRKVTVIYLQRI